ncbi:MAG: peptidoglycan-binding domain-containing protein [Acutalibacteraceae bacterium]
MKMNSPGAKFKKMLAVCLAAVLLFAVGSIAVYKQSASHSTEVLSKMGSRGEEVRQIQTKLKSKGIYSGSVDGISRHTYQRRGKEVSKIRRSYR